MVLDAATLIPSTEVVAKHFTAEKHVIGTIVLFFVTWTFHPSSSVLKAS